MGAAAVADTGKWGLTRQDWADAQGLVISGYGNKPVAAFMLLTSTPPSSGLPGAWVAALADRITPADGERSPSLNIAFTAAGLRALGLDDRTLDSFSRAFRQGLSDPDRARSLGDIDDQDPKQWRWHGAKDGDPVHALLMLFADDQAMLAAEIASLRALLAPFPVQPVGEPIVLEFHVTPHTDSRTGTTTTNREHFGFSDGLSQPSPQRRSPASAATDWHGIPVGDILMGYPNTYDVPAPGPLVDPSAEGHVPGQPEMLAEASGAPGLRDLGLNGSYLVCRQLIQDVAGFWQAIAAQAPGFVDESGKPATAEWLAERIVGRTIDGDMLTATGTGIRPRQVASDPDNDFGFLDEDRQGFGCPIGSHVRRANPRDGLAPKPDGGAEALHSANRHRILRRGRPYGPLLTDRMTDDGIERGLMFVALNTDIERQFEFIQHTWIENVTFGGLYGEADPMIGQPGPFTIPGAPIRQRVALERYVTVVGGEYFFLPGMRALRYLGTL